MKRFQDFCVFAAALGMAFGGIGLAALCFRRPETAVALGCIILPFGAAAFLGYYSMLHFAPRQVAGRRLDKCAKNGGMALLMPYEGNEDIWLETSEDAGDGDGGGVLVALERREGMRRLFFSVKRERLHASGLEDGARVWVLAMVPGGSKGVWLLGVLGLPEEGGAYVAVQEGKLPGKPGKYHFDAAGR